MREGQALQQELANDYIEKISELKWIELNDTLSFALGEATFECADSTRRAFFIGNILSDGSFDAVREFDPPGESTDIEAADFPLGWRAADSILQAHPKGAIFLKVTSELLMPAEHLVKLAVWPVDSLESLERVELYRRVASLPFVLHARSDSFDNPLRALRGLSQMSHSMTIVLDSQQSKHEPIETAIYQLQKLKGVDRVHRISAREAVRDSYVVVEVSCRSWDWLQ